MEGKGLRLVSGSRVKGRGKPDVRRAFKSVENVVRESFKSVIDSIEAETRIHGEVFWSFPYSQPVESLGSARTYGTLLDGKARKAMPDLDDEARRRLGGVYRLYTKAGANVPNDFSKLESLMSAGTLPIESTWLLPIKEKSLDTGVIGHFLNQMEWIYPDGEPDYGQDDVKYLALCAACALCGAERLEPALRKKRREPSEVRTRTLTLPNDPITKAMFGRGENHITPADYMNGIPRKIRTGKNLSTTVLIQNDFDITEACEAYQLNDMDRFWLETVCSIAKDGHTSISGYDLLKVNGFKNPHSKGMRNTMRQALDSVVKAASIWVTIDTSEEDHAYAKSVGTELNSGIVMKRIVSADISLLDLANGAPDFRISLLTDDTGDPISALPLARYASNKRQLISAVSDDFDFKTIKRMTFEHKRMWRYVVRRISEKGTSNTILFETMFRELCLEGITRQKRSSLIDVLRTMLAERRDDARRLELLSNAEDLADEEKSELESLRARKLVSAFKFAKKGKSIHSVTVNFT